MTVNRAQMRSLLLPGRYKWDGQRGVPFTDEEFEAVVDAVCASGNPSDGNRIALGFIALPMILQAHQRQLSPLRSVSRSYKQSVIPTHFRRNQEKTHDDRRSTQKAPRRTPQPPDTGWHGGSQQVAGGTGAGGGTHISFPAGGITIVPGHNSNLLFYGNTYTHTGISQQQLSAAQGVGLYPNSLPPYMVPYTPPKPLPTEIKAGEIVAWRCWRKRDGKLYSIAMSTTEWMPNVPMTGEPSKSEAEGVHAWKTEAQARKYATDYLGQAGGVDVFLLGTVELWGEVIEHDEGYRAEYAAIKDIVETLTPLPVPAPGNPYLTGLSGPHAQYQYSLHRYANMPRKRIGRLSWPILGGAAPALLFAYAASVPPPILGAVLGLVLGIAFIAYMERNDGDWTGG